ncbi:MAG TPA: HAMP domain-containing sensor histidine kinase, partial [Phycisphaerales bacterium]|nr:HAMP domain-containing sensor histidine kinase [Phycisphaerales bacterium]
AAMDWTGVFLGLGIGAAIGLPLAAWEVKRQTRRARDAERRAHAAERLAEIGSMTGGLAHEIKNPLSTIGLNAQLLAEGVAELPVDSTEKSRLTRRVEALRREAERLRDILQDFLRYAGEVRIEPHVTDLNTVVEELVDFYAPQAHQMGITLRSDLAPGAVRVNLDAPHFKQAILNLLINAAQAIEEQLRQSSGENGMGSMGAPTPIADPRPPTRTGKEIIVRTSIVKSPRGPMAELRVIDTGPGIPPETLASIFTPYFTTKSGGSGLGLPTARRLIEAHGGRITVNSELDKGTEFLITLPAA